MYSIQIQQSREVEAFQMCQPYISVRRDDFERLCFTRRHAAMTRRYLIRIMRRHEIRTGFAA